MNNIEQRLEELEKETNLTNEEKDLIIANAFKFLKRKDLYVLDYSVCDKSLSIKNIDNCKIYETIAIEYYEIANKIMIKYFIGKNKFSGCLIIKTHNYSELYNLFVKINNEIFEYEINKYKQSEYNSTFMQSMIDNYSDNDEHSDGSIEEAYEQAEKEFKGWFKLPSDIYLKPEIPMAFKTQYRRKSDEKQFVLIWSERGKIQMKGITPEKEVVEKDVGLVMMYGLICFDISKEVVIVDENQLQEEYERVN